MLTIPRTDKPVDKVDSPKSDQGRWLHPLLLPFMVYVALACPLALLIPATDSYHHNNHNLSLILPGYGVSRYVLLFGAVAQGICRRVGDGLVTFAFAVAAHLVYNHPWFHT